MSVSQLGLREKVGARGRQAQICSKHLTGCLSILGPLEEYGPVLLLALKLVSSRLSSSGDTGRSFDRMYSVMSRTLTGSLTTNWRSQSVSSANSTGPEQSAYLPALFGYPELLPELFGAIVLILQVHASEILRIIYTQNIVEVLNTLFFLVHPAPNDQKTSTVHDKMVARVVVFIFALSEGIAPVGNSIDVRGVEGARTGVELGRVVHFSGDIGVSVLVCPSQERLSTDNPGLEDWIKAHLLCHSPMMRTSRSHCAGVSESVFAPRSMQSTMQDDSRYSVRGKGQN